MRKLPTGEDLRDRAKELGVITDSDDTYAVPSEGNVAFQASDHEIQRRVIEAERHLREHRLWIIAVISALASVISALAAWAAICYK